MKERINEPDLTDVIDGAIEDLLYSLNCHRVGIVQSFDPIEQTATIRMVDKGVKATTDGEELVDYSLLLDCPVMVNKGTNGGLTIPIIEGDTCLVCFNDRDMDNWLVDGLVQRPNTLRAHDFSDVIAIVGIRNQLNKITDYNNEATEINYLDNKISIDNTKINLLNSLGGSIVIDDKLELKNTAENLKSLIDELITIITNLSTVDPISGNLPIDGATASSLATLSTRVGDLLK
jgi:hypothetical protein